MTDARTVGQLSLCIAGIYASYLTQGLVQENLSVKKYGLLGDRFPELKSLTGTQAITCFAWAGLLLLFQAKKPGQAPFTAYWKPAISNSIGPACGYQALRNISYPAQVLAKSCKMIPVMIMGTILGGKRYGSWEYVCAGLIAVGISLFAQRSSNAAARKLVAPNAPWGYFLCVANLVLDGYTNAEQDEVQKRFRATTPVQTMCFMNFWGALYYGAYLFIISNSGSQLVAFCRQHPSAASDVLLFCLCGAVGQLFIFYTIRNFGSLVNTLICTTRKFFNILLSVLWHGSPLLPQQWVAVSLVFSGLLINTIVKSRRTKLVKKVD